MSKWVPEMPNIGRFYLLLLVVSISLGCNRRSQTEPTGGEQGFQALSGDNQELDRERWNRVFETSQYVFGRDPAALVFEAEKYFATSGGVALDIAMGEGRNAVFAAQKGYQVTGVDFSDSAILKALRLAREKNVKVNAVNADLKTYAIAPGTYDLILNIDFLERSLIPKIRAGLKPGGIVVFENFTLEHLRNEKGRGLLPEFLLSRGELKGFFQDYEILVYREQNDGKEAKASLIARKPRSP